MMPRIDPPTLIAEKRLVHIWRAYAAVEPSSFNFGISIAVFVLILFSSAKAESPATVANQIRVIADVGLNITVSILGFLIAGYTILASTSDLEMLQRMAEAKDEKSGLSVLKRNYFALMIVFIEYLTLATVCVLIKFFAYDGGPLDAVVDQFNIPTGWRLVLCKIVLGGLCAFITFDLMELKSFIFNVHHFVMTTVAWSLTIKYGDEDARKQLKPPASANDGDSNKTI